jgi:hypothetical protein
MHILIVDDSDAFRASLRGLLDRVELSGGARPDGILEAEAERRPWISCPARQGKT